MGAPESYVILNFWTGMRSCVATPQSESSVPEKHALLKIESHMSWLEISRRALMSANGLSRQKIGGLRAGSRGIILLE